MQVRGRGVSVGDIEIGLQEREPQLVRRRILRRIHCVHQRRHGQQCERLAVLCGAHASDAVGQFHAQAAYECCGPRPRSAGLPFDVGTESSLRSGEIGAKTEILKGRGDVAALERENRAAGTKGWLALYGARTVVRAAGNTHVIQSHAICTRHERRREATDAPAFPDKIVDRQAGMSARCRNDRISRARPGRLGDVEMGQVKFGRPRATAAQRPASRPGDRFGVDTQLDPRVRALPH